MPRPYPDSAKRENFCGGWDFQKAQHRFNGSGPEDLIDRKAPGKLPKLNSEQKARLATVVDEGPTPSVHGVVRWRLKDRPKATR